MILTLKFRLPVVSLWNFFRNALIQARFGVLSFARFIEQLKIEYYRCRRIFIVAFIIFNYVNTSIKFLDKNFSWLNSDC